MAKVTSPKRLRKKLEAPPPAKCRKCGMPLVSYPSYLNCEDCYVQAHHWLWHLGKHLWYRRRPMINV